MAVAGGAVVADADGADAEAADGSYSFDQREKR